MTFMRPRDFIRKLPFLLLIIFTTMTTHAQKTPSAPDFAYPKTVAANARKQLDAAKKSHDGNRLVRAAIDLSLAKAAVNGDDLPAVITEITQLASEERSPETRALLNSLLAKIYSQIYEADRWKYDRRQLPLNNFPGDYNEWSGEMFRLRIKELADKSLADRAALQKAPLGDYRDIVACDGRTSIFYPTLYDFIASQAIGHLTELMPTPSCFSPAWLCRAGEFEGMSFTYANPDARNILGIYSELLRFHRDKPAPFILNDINRIDFIARNIADNGTEREYTPDGAPIPAKNTPQQRRRELLQELYDSHKGNEYSSEALIAITSEANVSEPDPALYKQAQKAIAAYPDYFRNCELQGYLNRCAQKSIDITAPDAVVPGDSLRIAVSGHNLTTYKIGVFRVPYPHNGRYNYSSRSGGIATLVATLDRSCTGTVPYSVNDTLSITFDTPGCYILVPSIDGSAPTIDPKRSYQRIHCSALAIATGSYGQSRQAWVIDPLTGVPVADATLELVGELNSGTKGESYTTDRDGLVSLKKLSFPRHSLWNLYASKGKDTFAPAQRFYPYDNTDTLTRSNAEIYTSLAIYHPGDTVEWSAVAYSYKGILNEQARLFPAGKRFTATLRDANYQDKASVEVVTDRWGRMQGQFPLPADGLTGYFSIQLEEKDAKDGANGSARFMVSDYKLPTYELTVTDLLRDNPDKGAVTVKGRAVTYSGFPLGGINVAVNLGVSERYPWWRMNNAGTPVYSTETTTGEDGYFEVTFPAALLAESPGRYKIFTAQFTSTSSTGENCQTSARFSTGASYIIESATGNGADIDLSQPFNPGVRVVDLMGKPVKERVRYLILDGETIVSQGHLSDNGTADCSDVPSGVYTVRFMLDSIALAAPVSVGDVAFYRPTDKTAPRNVPLWCPVTRYATPDGHASILYGSTGDYVQYTVWNDSTILSQGWLNKPAGMHRFDIPLPKGADAAVVTLSAMHGYRSASVDVDIRRDSSIRKLTLSAESFRDKITPGAEESWTFRVTDRTGAGVEAAMMLDMYCKALDAISPMPEWGRFARYRGATRFGINVPAVSTININKRLAMPRIRDCEQIISPQFETWGRGFLSEGMRGLVLCESAIATTDEMAPAAGAKLMVRGAAPVYMNKAAQHRDEAKVEEAEEVENLSAVSDSDNGAESGNGQGETTDKTPFSYRPAEQPLAFFRPMLSTDREGRMTFSFTAPNANTTWRLCAMAFTDDVASATFSRDVLSNKPVMVQPNMPRFLRSGDKAVIMASVMNNTDSTQVVTTDVEIFDPATGAIITSSTQTGRIAPRQSETVTTEVEAPFDAPLLGYRVKSRTATFADGEQTAIAVLPSSQPVVETTPFYIAPDSVSYSVKLPKMPSDARVTLQFCENPAWYCVTALPGLRNGSMRTSSDASASIFSAAVAEGILRDNPSIARALRQWSESDKSDSTLVSMLERNQDLKIVLLNATPWVMDARSDTERMERLALLFDKKEIQSAYSKAIALLSTLQRSNGGWAWIDESGEPSQWATMSVLDSMGRLRQLGYLPSDSRLSSMITDAVLWLDKETAAQYRKYPKADYTAYVAIRDYFKDIKQSSAAARVTASTVQRIIADWKRYDVADKATAALILNDNGYHTTATRLLASLREYSVYTPATGRHWPSLGTSGVPNVAATALILDAFNSVEPGCRDIDQIRQWLILQKEAQNWGNSVATSDAIASILGSGTKWTVPAAGVEIKVNDTLVPQTTTDRQLGYLRTSISALSPSDAMLSISKTPAGPAWGAVYCQYRGEMKDIEPQSCEAVSVEKRFYVQRGDQWEEAETFTVGDRVRVDLVIKSTRDMDYVAIIDNRGACFEPVEQLPRPIFAEGIYFYRENRDSATDMFVTHMPKGTYLLSYELFANNSGRFSSGVASLQSQYAPAMSAHSSGRIVTVKAK